MSSSALPIPMSSSAPSKHKKKRRAGARLFGMMVWEIRGYTLFDLDLVDDDLAVLGGLETIDGLADGGGVEAVVNHALGIAVDGETGLAAVDIGGKDTAVSLRHVVEDALDTACGKVLVVVAVAQRAGVAADSELDLLSVLQGFDDEVGELHEAVAAGLNGVVEETLDSLFGVGLLGTSEALAGAGHVVALGSHVVVIEAHVLRAGGLHLGARVGTVVLEIESDGFGEVFLDLLALSLLLLGGNLLLVDEGHGDLDGHVHRLAALGAGDHLGEGLDDAEGLVVKFLIAGAVDHLDVGQGAVFEDFGLDGGGAGDFLVLEVDRILFGLVDIAAHCLVATLESGERHGGSGRDMLSV